MDVSFRLESNIFQFVVAFLHVITLLTENIMKYIEMQTNGIKNGFICTSLDNYCCGILRYFLLIKTELKQQL